MTRDERRDDESVRKGVEQGETIGCVNERTYRIYFFIIYAPVYLAKMQSARMADLTLGVIQKTRSRYCDTVSLPEWIAWVYHAKQRWDVVSCRIKRSVNERLTRRSWTDRYGDIRDDRRSLMRGDTDEIRYSIWARGLFFISKCPVIAFFDITSRDYPNGDKSPRY